MKILERLDIFFVDRGSNIRHTWKVLSVLSYTAVSRLFEALLWLLTENKVFLMNCSS
jgi:hypothetical protein